MARRRGEWLEANGPCVDCGRAEDLQVDHEDATTKISHKVWSWSAKRRLAELAKCVVRCRPCHTAKTIRNKEYGDAPAGERSGAAKLTADKVRAIRASGQSTYRLAQEYGINSGTVSLIRRRLTWKHVA